MFRQMFQHRLERGDAFRVPSDPLSMALGSAIASTYVQPHIGSDAALFLGLLKGVIEAGAVDQAFIDAHTSDWQAVRAQAEATPWAAIVEACGVPRAELDVVVRALTNARRGIFLWAMGLTHHANGVENIEALANLALARGWLGRAGCGLLPIRGHSNVQGVGSVGVSPALRDAFARGLEARYGIAPTLQPGQHTYASMEAAAAGRVQAALLLGGNLFASNPDRAWAAAALRAIPFTVAEVWILMPCFSNCLRAKAEISSSSTGSTRSSTSTTVTSAPMS